MTHKLLVLPLLLCGLYLEGTIAAGNRFFPDGFKFGTASASYQVEGGWDADGKGENIWDRICHTHPDYIANDDNGDVAADSYHKWEEDVALLTNLGVDYYRFSISWSRILPKGLAGTPINQPGLDYYKNLIQALLDNGIEPMVTMFHWDTPQPLQDIGGWPSPELEDHFAYYARILFEHFGDSVKLWMTFNEPLQTCQQGYGRGSNAPGIQASGVADYQCAHTLLKAHARVYHLYDDEFRSQQQGTVGIVADTTWFEPASSKDEDKEAAERILQFTYGWFLNPVVNGDYPQVMIDRVDDRSKRQNYTISRLPKFTSDEIDYIKGTHDFITINAYRTNYAEWQEEPDISEVSYESDTNVKSFGDIGSPGPGSTPFNVNVFAWGLRKLLNWLSKTYGNPEIFITENGSGDRGGLEDYGRINYHREFMSNLLDAILDDGVNVTRYTVWSLIDDFEWQGGYTVNLGLHRVDFDDPERPRTPKASAAFYKQVIATRCLVDECK